MTKKQRIEDVKKIFESKKIKYILSPSDKRTWFQTFKDAWNVSLFKTILKSTGIISEQTAQKKLSDLIHDTINERFRDYGGMLSTRLGEYKNMTLQEIVEGEAAKWSEKAVGSLMKTIGGEEFLNKYSQELAESLVDTMLDEKTLSKLKDVANVAKGGLDSLKSLVDNAKNITDSLNDIVGSSFDSVTDFLYSLSDKLNTAISIADSISSWKDIVSVAGDIVSHISLTAFVSRQIIRLGCFSIKFYITLSDGKKLEEISKNFYNELQDALRKYNKDLDNEKNEKCLIEIASRWGVKAIYEGKELKIANISKDEIIDLKQALEILGHIVVNSEGIEFVEINPKNGKEKTSIPILSKGQAKTILRLIKQAEVNYTETPLTSLPDEFKNDIKEIKDNIGRLADRGSSDHLKLLERNLVKFKVLDSSLKVENVDSVLKNRIEYAVLLLMAFENDYLNSFKDIDDFEQNNTVARSLTKYANKIMRSKIRTGNLDIKDCMYSNFYKKIVESKSKNYDLKSNISVFLKNLQAANRYAKENFGIDDIDFVRSYLDTLNEFKNKL